ncbi:hypothetical protein LMIY3S_01058 [Labrys miyagiensis]
METGSGSLDIVRRAIAAFNAGRPGEALQLCDAGLRGAPRDRALNHLVAAISLAAGDVARAEAAIGLALAGGTGSAPQHLLAARILAAAGKPVPALQHCEKAISMGASPEALLEQARLLTALGDARAMTAWQAVLKSSPRSGEAKARLGRLLWEIGKAGDAVHWLAQAADDGAPASVWFDLGNACGDLREWDRAAGAFRKALLLRPDFAEAAVNLGAALQETGDIEAAMAAYRTAYQKKPSTFGMIAMALTSAPTGRLCLDAANLRRLLAA